MLAGVVRAGAMHILVAEDDHDIAELISHYLKKAGWTTQVAAAGDQALAYIRNHPVDVVILDLMLPGMSGLDVCQALRGDEATASVPVIMLTARAEESDRRSEEHTSELQSLAYLVCRLLLEKKKPSL